MPPIIFYHFPMSGPSRGALFAARAIGVPLEVEYIDSLAKEHQRDGFSKTAPQPCSPTLDDGGFVLKESRAIVTYLADKFGRSDQLYPQNLSKRAIVNERLFYDASSLFIKVWEICCPIVLKGATEITKAQKDDLNTSLGFLEKYLSKTLWVAGDHYTIADCVIYASVSSIMAFGWDLCAFPNIQRWVKDCAAIPGYEENNEGAKKLGEIIKSKLKHKLI